MDFIKIEEIIENFSLLEDWEDLYSYIIELGNFLPNTEENLRQEHLKISGCVSQVWLKIEQSNGLDPIFKFYADSDALIVRGLIVILLAFYGEKKASAILQSDPEELFTKLHIHENISRQRNNGLQAIICYIRKKADDALAGKKTKNEG